MCLSPVRFPGTRRRLRASAPPNDAVTITESIYINSTPLRVEFYDNLLPERNSFRKFVLIWIDKKHPQ
eukprot:1179526-Pleurochrysis_carterae.AAC.1